MHTHKSQNVNDVPMLTEEGYKATADAVLEHIAKGGLSRAEMFAVLERRLRDRLEGFIRTRGGGEAWEELLDTMIAMQALRNREEEGT